MPRKTRDFTLGNLRKFSLSEVKNLVAEVWGVAEEAQGFSLPTEGWQVLSGQGNALVRRG
jgi:hypothetical protein